MARLTTARRYIWLVPLLVGLLFVGAGAFMLNEGRAAKNDVREALTAEKITTSQDAAIPNAPVNSAATAEAQANAILGHVLKTTDGKTYAELDRNDPNRNTYLTSVTLRTALNLAVMGFKVSDLVMGLGAFMIAVGAVHALVLAPALAWVFAGAAEPQAERAEARRRFVPVQTRG